MTVTRKCRDSSLGVFSRRRFRSLLLLGLMRNLRGNFRTGCQSGHNTSERLPSHRFQLEIVEHTLCFDKVLKVLKASGKNYDVKLDVQVHHQLGKEKCPLLMKFFRRLA